jgi:hypothetical protein
MFTSNVARETNRAAAARRLGCGVLALAIAGAVALCVLALSLCSRQPEPEPIVPPIPTGNQPP